MKRSIFSATAAMTALMVLAQPVFGQYSSTTSITASNDQGDINGTIEVNYTSSCADLNNEGVVSLWIGNDYFPAIGLDYDTEFDSEGNLIDIIYGPGSYLLQASFAGFAMTDMGCYVSGSSASTTVVVPQDSSALTLSLSSPASIREGQKLQLNVTITGSTLYTEGPYPTGSVVLFQGSQILASSSVQSESDSDPITSSASFNLPTAGVTPGKYNLSVVYTGDSNLKKATQPLQITVTNPQVATTIALATSPNPVVQRKTLTLTATVTPTVSGITPTGTVNFLVGTTSIGTAKLNSSGVATLTDSTTGIAPGVYAVHASYGGDAYDYASVSGTQNVTVQAATATTLTANPTTVTEGQTVDLSATVKRTQSSGEPTGTVAFQFAGYTFATTSVNGSGVATASISTKNLSSGTYPLTAIYNGDTLDAASTSATVNVTVQ